ncbi:MAG TPA: TonB-dependent receptor [Candidatus Acidoferrum sp.]|nr:TonB-dependent receptor [Candidatus Acidoferrum sp.]
MSNRLAYSFLRSALVLCLVFGGLWSSQAWGQITGQGTIAVRVLDPSGAAVPDANLTLVDLASNRTRPGVTDASGTYTFVALPVGTYKLTVAKGGFGNQVLEAVAVQATRTTDVTVSLTVGTQATEVTVSEAAPAVEKTSNAITGTIDLGQVEDLPVIGRDISQLSQIVPGAVSNGGETTWNGMPLAATGNNIDGVIATTSRMKFAGASQPLVEARIEDIQEMTVQTDQLNMNTGYGQSNFQVNFVTRRGSNILHGRLFEDHRNSALNANSWVNDASGAAKPKYHLNDFGGSIGGAAIKDKLFFFGTFAMSKQPGSYQTGGTTFPTAAAQAGNFTWTDSAGTHTVNILTQIAGPAGQPSTVNSVTAGLFSAINGSLSGGAVTPTADPNINSIAFAVQSPITYWYPTVRVDYNIKDNLRMYVSWNMTQWNQPGAGAPPYPGSAFQTYGASNKFKYYTAALGFDWTITPTIINQFRGGYLYNLAKYSYDASNGYLKLPEIDWPGSVGTSGQVFSNLPINTFYPLINGADNVSWQRGKHLLNFGFSYYREQDHYDNAPAGFPFDAIGLVTDDPATSAFENYFATNFPKASATDRSNAEDLYSVIRGRISGVSPGGAGFPYDLKTKQYSTTVSGYNLDELQSAWGLFGQDAWRLRPDLTVNLGLRWDFTGDDHDLTGAYHSADPVGIWGPSGVGNIFKPGVLTSDPAGLNPSYVGRVHVYKPWNVSPQPSIGLAWNPSYTDGVMGKLFKGGKTVVRTGFALRRFTEPYQFFWNSASNSGYAFYQAFNLSPVTPGAPLPATGGYYAGSYELGNSQPAPYTLSPATYQNVIPESNETFFGYWTGVNGINPNIHQPYVESWNLGIQREVSQNNVIEIRYQGNRSVHQWVKLNPNEVNIFENGFLAEFKLAQKNLAINQANGNGNTFANNGLAGQSPLPILTAAFTNPGGLDPSGFTNGTFINYLTNGRAGDFASALAGSSTYLCNLIGSASFSPCALNGVANPGHGYPINFFQANPYNAGKATGYLTDPGFGDYHALQVDWRQRQWHGAQFDVNYTWSHTLGVQPGDTWTGAFRLFSMRDLRLSYGPTLFDVRHTFHANGTYDLPFGKGKAIANHGGAVDKIVGGWNIGTIVTYQTGLPSQLIGGFRTTNGPSSTPFGDALGDGGVVFNGATLSQLQSSVGVHSAPGQTYAFGFDPALRSKLSANTTAGISTGNPYIYGPHEFFQDLAITKIFRIRENLRFSFQSEFENVWNHPVWGSPNTNVRSTNFGHIGVMQTFLNGLLKQGERQIGFRANLEF